MNIIRIETHVFFTVKIGQFDRRYRREVYPGKSSFLRIFKVLGDLILPEEGIQTKRSWDNLGRWY
jgi:hypothetical protein